MFVVARLVNPAVGFEEKWGIGKVVPVDDPKRVLAIGGRPGGLKAVETAALRGHDVTLLAASDQLGSQVLVAAAAMPYRDEFANSVRFLEAEFDRLGVKARLGTKASLDPLCMGLATVWLLVGRSMRWGGQSRVRCPEADWPSCRYSVDGKRCHRPN